MKSKYNDDLLELLQDITVEKALIFCKKYNRVAPNNLTMIAGLHKLRLMHKKIDNLKKEESRLWLLENGYKYDLFDNPLEELSFVEFYS